MRRLSRVSRTGLSLTRRGGAAVAAPATFPSSPTVLLYASDGASGSPVVQNRASALAIPSNLLGNSRPMELPYMATTASGGIVRTASVAGEDGAAKAVRYAYTPGTGPVGNMTTIRLAAGTYTMAARIISNTGGSCTFRLARSVNVSESADLTATTSWTTVTYTFTLASATTISVAVTDGGSAAAFDITVDKIAVFSGASAGAFDAQLNNHIQVSPNATGMTMSGNVITGDNSSVRAGARVMLALTESQRSAVSIVAAVRMDPASTETNATVYPLLTEVESAAELNSLSGGLIFGQRSAALAMGGPTGSLSTYYAGANKAGWCVITAVAGPSGVALYVNGLKAASNSTTYAGGTFRAIELMGLRDGITTSFPGKVAVLGLWERAFDASEVSAAYAAAVAQITAHGETFTDFGTVLVAEGDSITFGSGDTGRGGYIDRAGRKFATRLQAVDYAVAGATMTASPLAAANDINAANRKTQRNAKINEVIGLGKRCLYSVLIGANNTGPIEADPTTYYNLLKAHMDEVKAINSSLVRTVVQTMTDQSTYTAGQRSAVATFNQLVRDGFTAGDFDGLVDHASTAMGTYSAGNFADTVHPNATGHDLMATTYQTAVNGLVI